MQQPPQPAGTKAAQHISERSLFLAGSAIAVALAFGLPSSSSASTTTSTATSTATAS